jgi:hypothetical protein
MSLTRNKKKKEMEEANKIHMEGGGSQQDFIDKKEEMDRVSKVDMDRDKMRESLRRLTRSS